MMKRSNEGIGGESYANSPNDDSQQKRRKVQFEPVRMPAVSNVNDIRSRAIVYQASKLRQQLQYKNKRIAELEKENERAKRRQQTDESNFLKVYNLFSGIEKYICTQTKNEFGDYIGGETAPTGTEVQGMTPETYNKFVDQSKLNLRNAFVSYAKARHDRASELSQFVSRVRSIIDDPKHNFGPTQKELAARTVQLASQNEKLQSEVTRLQSDCYNSDRKRRHLQDKYSVLETKVQELEHQLEEARFEVDKQVRLANKFEHRLATLASEGQLLGGSAIPSSSGITNLAEKKLSAPTTPPNEATAKEIETLRLERDEQASLASRRLQELDELNKRVQTITQENSKLKMDTHGFLSVDAITNSEEYKNLKRYYSLAIKEYERVSKDLEDVTNERDAFRSTKETRAMLMAEEHQKTIKEIQNQSDIHNTFYRVSHDSEILRCEFETVKEEYNKAVKQSEWDEMKATLNTLRSMNKSMKSEIVRLRAKDKLSHKDIHSLKSELKSIKEHQEKCLLVPLEETVNVTTTDDINKLRQENESMRKEVKRLGTIEKKEKQKQIERFQEEVNRQITDKLAELETLRKTNEALTNDEQCISDELESIGIAVEEEQERNAQLHTEKREQEDRNLKMMNDRMIQNQVLNRMREKLECLENKAQTDAQIAKMHEFEKKTTDEMVNKLSETLQFKSAELTRLTNLMEQHRKTMQEVGMVRDENQLKAERCEAQLKQIQELYVSKSREMEDIKFKRQRAEEELEAIRVKYERAKRNESTSAQSGDQVLEEANRQMKETLTCPSCKTRPKDCIMLKCYHLFCETCIKTMYDIRQRKCPKCNSNFGANDFHRIFI